MPDGHRSSPGQAPTATDRRVTDLTQRLHSTNLLDYAGKAFAKDPHRGIGLETFSHAGNMPVRTGKIVYAMPFAHWYKVQLDGMDGSIGCCLGGESGFLPVGPASTGLLMAGCNVVVIKPPGLPFGIILTAFPLPQHDGRLMVPDWVQQGSQAGFKREAAYTGPLQQFYREGGIYNFNANRPVDGTTLDWGKCVETGLGIHLDPFQAFIRVNELCGLFLNYYDSHARLAGLNLDIQSAVHEIIAREDEGEARYIENASAYPWEALGLYRPGVPNGQVFSDADVQYNIPKGKLDLVDDQEDLQAINRYQEFGGYLGQGRQRLVMIPAKTSGLRRYADDPAAAPDMGVFRESIGLDGTYSITAARQVLIAKRVLIPVAKEMRLPEDQMTGDDARKGNYKFSGEFGDAAPHKIGDLPDAAAPGMQHVLRAAAIMDVLSYNLNWKPLHAFYYHTQDFKVPEESDIQNLAGAPNRLQDMLDFSALTSATNMAYPAAKQVTVDHRYGPVDYFQREAGVAMLPDGSVRIYDGYGSAIVLAGGHIRLECPGDVQLLPGRNLTSLVGRDIVLRAKNSLDATAGNGNVTVKAEKSLMLLGGNAAGGGVLIEAKSPGFAADFSDKVGEDVQMGGILLKAAKSSVVTWAGDIYLRTGTDSSSDGSLTPGNITLDAGTGGSQVSLKGESVSAYCSSFFAAYIGPDGTDSAVQAAYVFDNATAVFGGSLVAQGSAIFTESVVCGSSMQSYGGFASVTGGAYVGTIRNDSFTPVIASAKTSISSAGNGGKTTHDVIFVSGLYAAGAAGNDQTIVQAAFSFRDDPQQAQYNTQSFQLVESAWQMMARLGMGSGGTAWTEPVVNYQGRELLPYPGQQKWINDPALLQLTPSLVNPAAGIDIPRANGAYENPQFPDVTSATLAAAFKTIM